MRGIGEAGAGAVGKNRSSEVRHTWLLILALTLAGPVIFGKSSKLSEPQSPCLHSGDDSIYFIDVA